MCFTERLFLKLTTIAGGDGDGGCMFNNNNMHEDNDFFSVQRCFNLYYSKESNFLGHAVIPEQRIECRCGSEINKRRNFLGGG